MFKGIRLSKEEKEILKELEDKRLLSPDEITDEELAVIRKAIKVKAIRGVLVGTAIGVGAFALVKLMDSKLEDLETDEDTIFEGEFEEVED